MNYPFFKHKDIRILYWSITSFIILFISSLIFNLFKLRLLSQTALVLLTILLIGHEIIIVLLDKPTRRRKTTSKRIRRS